ncbi:MAG: TetR/AcrR family transcriptional regulator [Thiotrichales bacterium]|nr:MAG: TetR/AcrR family transcriptional regulator [Thiotrichales bacterium]
MPTKGELTRENILGIAEHIILQKGFSGTSIDEIIEAADITKGGFFYHFKGKEDLAKHLMLRYQVADDRFFNQLFDRADSLSEDPLQQMLIFLKLLAEAMGDLPSTHPGCLVASFTYESQQFNEDVKQIVCDCIVGWRQLFIKKLAAIGEVHPMKIETDIMELADMLTSVIEGAIILSKAFNEPERLVNQILQYRNHIRLLYGDT